MHPQPLLGVLAHPAFDHRRDRLHGALDVDLAVGIARRLDGLGQIDAEAMAGGQADDARAVDRAISVPRPSGEDEPPLAAAPAGGPAPPVPVTLVDGQT